MSPLPTSDPIRSPTGHDDLEASRWSRWRRRLIGAPRSLADRSIFHRLSLIPVLAWVGLGADGLSSSAYGPEETFRQLGEHIYLAVPLALLTIITVLVISAAYSRIIEEFPHGGGGYVVGTKMLGERAGVVSGSALLIDYVLTITISIAAAGDALFSFLPVSLHGLKFPIEILLVLLLTGLNARGVRESVIAMTPIFVVFVLTHLFLIVWGIAQRGTALDDAAREVAAGYERGLGSVGVAGLLLVLVRAFALGGGTYTGIEAVSNGLQLMREPRVATAKRTMLYMAVSLAGTAAGLLACYLLWDVAHVEGKTMNAVLVERVAGGLPHGHALVLLTLVSEGALLVVAAQAGFLDGPRVLANMAVDSWMPRRFAALSDRLVTQNGIVLMGGSAMIALVLTHGDVRRIVVMYSINVFVTFSLSMLGMARAWRVRTRVPGRGGRVALFTTGFVLCATILVITVWQKLAEGAWITLAVTGSLVLLCFAIRRHYRRVARVLAQLQTSFPPVPAGAVPVTPVAADDRATACILVSDFNGLGMHTTLNVFRTFPHHFGRLVFLSVGVIDSGMFKGEDAVRLLRAQTEETLRRYVEFASGLGVEASGRLALGTDAVDEARKLCIELAREVPRVTFFAGKVIFERERWFQRLLHNETAYAIQKRLQWAGQTMVILPVRIREPVTAC